MHLPAEADIAAARASIAGIARRTPLWRLDVDMPGTNIFLKLENLQPLGSFKIRAAVNAMKSKDPALLRGGVIGASAGNFGQGLAMVAQRMGIPATIVAPDGAAKAKTDALEAMGAKVIRIPFADWWQVLLARRFEGAEGVFFHPVAEQAVVAGNATIAAEILEDLDQIDAVVVPFGGGGLISGIGSVMRRMKPNARMLAVEAVTAQPLAAALAAGGPVKVQHTPSFVDGIGSGMVLDEMWPLIRESVDQALSVSLAEIAGAIRLLAAKHHVIAEGAGAAPVAAALSGRAGKGNIVCIISGGNIDAVRLAAILSGQMPA
jgi:threonine dehydratase